MVDGIKGDGKNGANVGPVNDVKSTPDPMPVNSVVLPDDFPPPKPRVFPSATAPNSRSALPADYPAALSPHFPPGFGRQGPSHFYDLRSLEKSSGGFWKGVNRFLDSLPLRSRPPRVGLGDEAKFEILTSIGGGRLDVLLPGEEENPGVVVRGNLYDVANFLYIQRMDSLQNFFDLAGGVPGVGDSIALADMVFELRHALSHPEDEDEYNVRYNKDANMYEISFSPRTEDLIHGAGPGYWQRLLETFRAQEVRDLEEIGAMYSGFTYPGIREALEGMIRDVGSNDAEFLTQLLGNMAIRDLIQSGWPRVDVGIRTILGSRPELLLRFTEVEFTGGQEIQMPEILNISTLVGRPSDDGKKVVWVHDSTDPEFARSDLYADIIRNIFAGVQEHVMTEARGVEDIMEPPPGSGNTPTGTTGSGQLSGSGTSSPSGYSGVSEASMLDGAGRLFGFGLPAQSSWSIGTNLFMSPMLPMFRAI